MRYNAYFANHFRTCRLLVTGHDPHRNRTVEVRMIPGEFDVVGISDGVECWVAPTTVAPSELFDRVRKVLLEIRSGRDPRPADLPRERRPLHLPPQPENKPVLRRRPVVVQAEEQPTPRPRRVLHP